MSKIYHTIVFIFIIFLFPSTNCLSRNPAIGILTDTNIYIARISELNYTNDEQYLIYHHNDPVYHLQSFTANNFINRIYVCSPNTIYTLDLRMEATLVPLSPVDDTPCRSSLTYLHGKATLVWALRHSVIELDFESMSKKHLWNSTSIITDMIYNSTTVEDKNSFYLGVALTDHESIVLYCRSDGRYRILPFESCIIVDSDYQEVSGLAINNHILYVADRVAHKIYALTLSPNGFLVNKDILPLNTSTVADIQSMFIHNDYLVWLTRSGHVRIVSLITYEVRYLFWFDEQLRAIRLVSFGQWPNQTTTTKASTTTHSTTTTTTTVTTTITTTSNATTEITTTTQYHNDDNYSPWKATTYLTSIILGIALFLCAAMITCVLLNYRLGRVVPHSFTNIFHVLRHRTVAARSTPEISDDTLA
ncbi:unnamed protein product [Rotaria socialis]|nr:unnamed protein product [Rotaria socialis]